MNHEDMVVLLALLIILGGCWAVAIWLFVTHHHHHWSQDPIVRILVEPSETSHLTQRYYIPEYLCSHDNSNINECHPTQEGEHV